MHTYAIAKLYHYTTVFHTEGGEGGISHPKGQILPISY